MTERAMSLRISSQSSRRWFVWTACACSSSMTNPTLAGYW